MITLDLDLTQAPTDSELDLLRTTGRVLAERATLTKITSITLARYFSGSDSRLGFGGVLWPAPALAPEEQPSPEETEAQSAAQARCGITSAHADLPGGANHPIPDSLVPYMHAWPDRIALTVRALEVYLRQLYRWEELQADIARASAADSTGRRWSYRDQSEFGLPQQDRLTQSDVEAAREHAVAAFAPLLWAGADKPVWEYLCTRAAFNVAYSDSDLVRAAAPHGGAASLSA